jgi:hypothetical protein
MHGRAHGSCKRRASEGCRSARALCTGPPARSFLTASRHSSPATVIIIMLLLLIFLSFFHGVSTHPLAHALHRNPPLQLRHESEGSQHLVVDLWLASSLTGVLELDGLGRVKAVHGWAGLVEVNVWRVVGAAVSPCTYGARCMYGEPTCFLPQLGPRHAAWICHGRGCVGQVPTVGGVVLQEGTPPGHA